MAVVVRGFWRRTIWLNFDSTMSTVNSDRHHYVEGVGDEVLLLVLLTVLVLAVIAYGACCRTSQGGAALGRPRAFDSGIGGRCPICLDDAPQKVVRTNCGHGFCAPCLHGWCERTSSVSARAMACPICRSVVTMLHIEYTPGDASTVHRGWMSASAFVCVCLSVELSLHAFVWCLR